jgi:hypothetical protein
MPYDKYGLVNETGSDILLTLKLKDIAGQEGGGFKKIKYYRDNSYITTLELSFHSVYNKEPIPPASSYPHLWGFFQIERNLHLFTPPEEIPEAIPYIDVFHYLIEFFIIYDAEGNVVMTLNDVTEESLTITKMAPHASNSSVQIKIVITPEIVRAGREKYARSEKVFHGTQRVAPVEGERGGHTI